MDSTASPQTPGGTGPDATPGTPPAGPDKIDEFFDSVRRVGITRSDDRWIGGVASGVAARFGVDALLVRAAFLVLALVSGAGLVLYAVGWALLPERSDGRIHLQAAMRGRFDAAVAGAGIVLILGFDDRPGLWGHSGNGWFDALFWTALVVFVVYLTVTYLRNRPGGSGGWANAPDPSAQTWGAAAGGGAAEAPAGAAVPAGTATWGRARPGGAAPVRVDLTKPGVPPSAPWTPTPVTPHTEPVVARRRGAGGGAVALVLGLGLLTYAGLQLAERADRLTVDPAFVPVAVTVVLAGLAIVVAGLRGRTSGALSAVAVVGMLVAVSAGPAGTGLDLREATRSGVGDETFRPTSVAEAGQGYVMGIGDMLLDLSDLDLDADETVRIPVQMTVGQLTVILPEDTAASADVSVRAGDARWTVDDGNGRDANHSVGGVGIRSTNFETPHVADGAEPQVHLDIRHGVGNVIIKEDS